MEKHNRLEHRAGERSHLNLESSLWPECGECTGGHCMSVRLGKGAAGSDSGKTGCCVDPGAGGVEAGVAAMNCPVTRKGQEMLHFFF